MLKFLQTNKWTNRWMDKWTGQKLCAPNLSMRGHEKDKILVTSIFSISNNVSIAFIFSDVNPLPHLPISGSTNSEANKDMMSKIWTNGDTII